MNYNEIQQGASVRIEISFKDPDTNLLAPVQEPVMVTFKDPSGTTLTPTAATPLGVGTYEARKAVNVPGIWKVRAVSSGAEPAVVEGRFIVRASGVI